MSFATRPKAGNRHPPAGEKKVGYARHAISVRRHSGRLYCSCHSERSRGIWSRMDDAPYPLPDVSTSLRFARHDKRRGAAFTLIELLVVISIITLLMALLLPTLSRVRRQAKSLGCQAKLRQSGLLFSTYAADSDGKLMLTDNEGDEWDYLVFLGGRSSEREDLLLCPMASRPKLTSRRGAYGDTFSPWWVYDTNDTVAYSNEDLRVGSYGVSNYVQGPVATTRGWGWVGSNTRAGATIPAYLDCIDSHLWAGYSDADPPPYEGCYDIRLLERSQLSWSCINRHDGEVNCLFLDWSVRRVGLKELWMLKWHKHWDTAGPWTKAGGVQPEDWPAWMRKFKDY